MQLLELNLELYENYMEFEFELEYSLSMLIYMLCLYLRHHVDISTQKTYCEVPEILHQSKIYETLFIVMTPITATILIYISGIVVYQLIVTVDFIWTNVYCTSLSRISINVI